MARCKYCGEQAGFIADICPSCLEKQKDRSGSSSKNLGYAAELLELMREANSANDIKRAAELANRIILQLPGSKEAEFARRFLADVDTENIDVATQELSPKLPDLLLSTTDEIDGFETVTNLGVVRGSTVRSRHVGSDFAAGLKSIVGGELKGVTKLIADGREQAFARMCREAESLGANGVKGLRFSTSQVWEGAAEVMAYGTAVLVKPAQKKQTDTGD